MEMSDELVHVRKLLQAALERAANAEATLAEFRRNVAARDKHLGSTIDELRREMALFRSALFAANLLTNTGGL
jgi:DNA-binding transcriptional regulator YiaG